MGGRSLELPTGCYLEHGEGAVIPHHPDGSIVGRLGNEGSEDGRNGGPSLRVRFLGGFEMLWDGEAIRPLMERFSRLGREWDMEPSPETRAIYSGILEGERRAR